MEISNELAAELIAEISPETPAVETKDDLTVLAEKYSVLRNAFIELAGHDYVASRGL